MNQYLIGNENSPMAGLDLQMVDFGLFEIEFQLRLQ